MRISPIKHIELLAAERGDVISLAQGIPSFDTPEPIKQAAIAAIVDGRAAPYSLTYGLPELRQVIAHDLSQNGMTYDWKQEIVVTCGAAEAIAATLKAFVTPRRREVILPVPSYASYPEMIHAADGIVRYVLLNERQGWSLDLNEIEAKIGPQTAAILIANPNNPTGHCYLEHDLRMLAEMAARHGAMLICDDVYKDFVFDGIRTYTPATDARYRDSIIRIFSFSKAYGMTGWRVAYAHGPANAMDRVVGVHDNLVTCAPVVSQYAAIAAITQGKPFVESFRLTLAKRRDNLCRWLDTQGEHFSYTKPNSAYFVFPRLLGSLDDWQFTRMLLADGGVAVVPGTAFGPNGTDHVRLCFGRSDQDLSRACARMDKWFASLAVLAI